MLASANRHLFHVTANAFVSVVIILDDFLRFLPGNSDALRQAPRFDSISDGEVNDLGKPASFFKLLICLRAEDETSSARVNVFAFLKCFEHYGVLRDMGQEPQFELRIIRGDDLVSLLCDEGTPDSAAHLTANG